MLFRAQRSAAEESILIPARRDFSTSSRPVDFGRNDSESLRFIKMISNETSSIVNFVLIDYDYATDGSWAIFYYWFNFLEAIAWCSIGVYVFARFLRNRKSWLEIIYTLLFFVFGLTDFKELQNLPLWLLAFKGIIFASIIYTRYLLKPFYPRLTI